MRKGSSYEREDVRRAGYLQPGDVVTVEIDGIGSLTNPIVSPGAEATAAAAETVAQSGG